jgi:transcriptional regulator with XRE-family HTH domain
MKIRLRDVTDFKKRLLLKGVSQRGFGRAINVSESYAAQIANGSRNPGPEIAKKIVDFLEVNFDDIFYIVDDYKSDQAATKVV